MSIRSLKSFVEGEKELSQLASLDVQRKALIKLAIVQAVRSVEQISRQGPSTAAVDSTTAKIARKGTSVPPPDSASVDKSKHEYELTISKLKQEHATKDKLHESKIDALKDEVEKLKHQLFQNPPKHPAPSFSQHPSAAGNSSSSRPGLSFSTSPYLSKLTSNSRGYLSPTINSLSRSIAAVPSPEDHLMTILSPIQPKRKIATAAQNAKPKRTYTNFNTLKRMNNLEGLTSDDIMNGRVLKQLNVPNARRAHVTQAIAPLTSLSIAQDKQQEQRSKTTTPGITTTITATSITATPVPDENGHDAADEEGTPSKSNVVSGGASSISQSEQDNLPTSAASSSLAASDDDLFASANSTMNTSDILQTTPTQKKQKKKRKLQLWKSETTKVAADSGQDTSDYADSESVLPSKVQETVLVEGVKSKDNINNSPNKGLNLEDEDLNTLNYYEDSNWAEENNNTPKKVKGVKRAAEDMGALPKKRKRNVFKID